MKKFNLNILTPLLLTFTLQGCMPDSLTKFKKDTAKKTTAAAATVAKPVVDETGRLISFTPPTLFYFYNSSTNSFTGKVGTVLVNELKSVADGSLGDPTTAPLFFESCALDVTGNTQTRTLPSGLNLDTINCKITGKPLAITSVTTEFCTDATKLTQVTCEASLQTWNTTTSKCSNPDYQYKNQPACTAARNKWYKLGSPIPYRIIMTYHNENSIQSTISNTIKIGIYKTPGTLNLTQPEKILMDVSPTDGGMGNILPVVTTSASVGAYARKSIIAGETSASGVAKFVDSTLNRIGINKLAALYVDDVTPFSQNGFISVLGTCSNATLVTRASCLGAAGIWTNSGKVGKIFAIDSSLGILYIENISPQNKFFSTNDQISSDANGYTSASFILEADDSYIFNDTSVDNDSQFYSAKFTVAKVVSVYETGALYSIKPISPLVGDGSLDVNNGVTFKISPALPTGLSFSTTTGIISGAFVSDLTATKYTITATNSLGTSSNSLYLSAITGPDGYSFTNKQIITVSNTALFKEGEELFQPITPPLTDSPKAKIKKILSGYKLAIETYNSDFLAGASLDSGTSYNSERAFIIPDNSCVNTNYSTQATCELAGYAWSKGPIYYNLALTLNTSGSYVAGDTLTTTAVVAGNTNGAGAKALVAGVFTAAKDILFVQCLTQGATGISSVKSFFEGDTVKPAVTIDQVDSENMNLTLTSAAGYAQGDNIVSSAHSSGYINKVNANIVSVSDISKQPAGTYFKVGQNVLNAEDYVATANPITAVTFDNLFALERNKKVLFHGNISAGIGITYSISPPLPNGLSLNTVNGSISGTATVAMPRKDYLITATNFIGSTSFVTSIEIRDYFQIEDKSGTRSFLLHKVGEGEVNRKCRVNSVDILNASNDKALDIRCFLDAEEEDLYFNKIKLNALSGPSVCEYIQYSPFYFQQFNPTQTVGTSAAWAGGTVIIGCNAGGTIPTADLCTSNYKTEAKPNLPSCDEGYLNYTELVKEVDGSGACVTTSSSVKKVSCAGKIAECTGGPLRDIFDVDKIESGYRSFLYSSVNGLDETWEISNPLSHDDLTNLRVANGTINNKCLSTNADANTLTTNLLSVKGDVSPMGSKRITNPGNFKGPTSNPYYEIKCLDAARDFKARIRIIVRDWNKSFRIDSGVDNQDFAAPAQNMNYSIGVNGIDYNNYYDWDDNYTLDPISGTATFNSCSESDRSGVHTEYKYPAGDI